MQFEDYSEKAIVEVVEEIRLLQRTFLISTDVPMHLNSRGRYKLYSNIFPSTARWLVGRYSPCGAESATEKMGHRAPHGVIHETSECRHPWLEADE